LIANCQEFEQFENDFDRSLRKLERLYYGLNFTREMTPRMYDMISSFGERFAVELLAYTLRCRGVRATSLMPDNIGLITDGKFGDATANLPRTAKNFQKHVAPLIDSETIVLIPGFFGVSEKGDVTTFGRGGSDYSAAVVAVAIQAEKLEIWKDVAGFMSADPQFVPEAQLIPRLSYEEAAELAYFGAKILHPRTVEPIRKKRLQIEIRNTLNPDAPGTLITTNSTKPKSLIKSVAHNPDIGVIKVHASGVGARPGILGRIADCLAENGLNIKSVITSQTCISLLLDYKDLEPGYHVLKSMRPKSHQRLEKLEHVAMIGIVGEGILQHKGVAAKCFTAVAQCGVNVEMISFGPSRAALYFLVHNHDLHRAVSAIHSTFFSTSHA
jgi:aspartate kinase